MDRKGLLYQLNPAQRAEAAVDLRAAADLIEQHGWVQHVSDRDGCLCAAEAILQATKQFCGDDCLGFQCRNSLALIALGKFIGMLVVVWNDTVAIHQSQVLAVMRECAAWLDELALVSA